MSVILLFIDCDLSKTVQVFQLLVANNVFYLRSSEVIFYVYKHCSETRQISCVYSMCLSPASICENSMTALKLHADSWSEEAGP